MTIRASKSLGLTAVDGEDSLVLGAGGGDNGVADLPLMAGLSEGVDALVPFDKPSDRIVDDLRLRTAFVREGGIAAHIGFGHHRPGERPVFLVTRVNADSGPPPS